MGIFLDSRMHSANLDQRIPRPWESGPMSQDVTLGATQAMPEALHGDGGL